MDQEQKRLISRLIDRLFIPDRSRAPSASIYKKKDAVDDVLEEILKKLKIPNVDTYISRCTQDKCIPWTGHTRRGYPKIKNGSNWASVVQILAILFIPDLKKADSDSTSRPVTLRRSCSDPSCVNILHHIDGEKAKKQSDKSEGDS